MFSKTIVAAFVATAAAGPLVERQISQGNHGIYNNDPALYPTCTARSPVAGQQFYLRCSNGAGYLQSASDGQLFCGSNTGIPACDASAPGQTSLKTIFLFGNGQLRDFAGRIVEGNGQVQANYGAGPGSDAYGICTNNLLLAGTSSTFYACKANPNDGEIYRIYTGPQVPQGTNPNCDAINLVAEPLSNTAGP